MVDMFEAAKIICKKCDIEMKPGFVNRGGAELRAVKCKRCGEVLIHPADLNCLEHFKNLKGKVFNVKLRVTGNSHAISIPKEIVNFMNEINKIHNNTKREMDDMVRLCFEDFKKLSVIFTNESDNGGRLR